MTVTLLVALGIAAAQGCQGPTRGLGVLGSAHGQGTHATDAQVPGASSDAHAPGTSADAGPHPHP
ncbi:hypothetical protein [Streptomyces purpurogeneiscleroticus]|uniref:hypothetical protein n=1 Tax=Streptomyces purpurogeneiscleroticus TaxID=68259 RepID=UPI0027E0B5D3|nr:hypothetical protein [Streptomyces purpurogeneiscleroticus]